MRIAIASENIFTHKKNITESICEEERSSLQIDFFNEYDLLEYCADIRFYDFIIAELSPAQKYQILDTMRTLESKSKENIYRPKTNFFLTYNPSLDNRDYKSAYSLVRSRIEKNGHSGYNKEIIPVASPERIGQMVQKASKEGMSNFIENVNFAKQEIGFKTNEDRKLTFVAKRKKSGRLDFNVFLYLLRHPGKYIPTCDILSATTPEPEMCDVTRIESALMQIRNFFRENGVKKGVENRRKFGYTLSL